MSDPISGGGGQALKIAMQQLQQMQQTQPQVQQTGNQAGGGVSNFQKTMQNQQANQTNKTNQVNQVNETNKANQTNKTRSIRNVAQTEKVQATQKTDKTRLNKVNSTKSSEKPGGLTKLMEGMSNRKKDMDKLIKSAMSGKAFNQKQLLALQYKVSTFSMEMDLTSKVVEKSTGGVKQAMNTQV